MTVPDSRVADAKLIRTNSGTLVRSLSPWRCFRFPDDIQSLIKRTLFSFSPDLEKKKKRSKEYFSFLFLEELIHRERVIYFIFLFSLNAKLTGSARNRGVGVVDERASYWRMEADA